VEPIDRHYQPQPAPRNSRSFATDGSHIDVDRHQPTHCYLINIGGVVLRYGAKPEAALDSVPHLYASDEDLFITSPEMQGRNSLSRARCWASSAVSKNANGWRNYARMSLPAGPAWA